MAVTTLEGIVENGQVRLLDPTALPERAKVYVVVPDPEMPQRRISSPQLADPAKAADFEKDVFKEEADAEL
jgi:hypothetical protein